MTRRRIKPDEEALWRKVADQTRRLHPEPSFTPEDFVSTMPAKQKNTSFEAVSKRIIGPKEIQQSSTRLIPAIADEVAAAPVQMNRKSFGQLKRGKMRPEAKIDLHGMTLDRAHPALSRFILSAHAQGKRLVLVVTGKGKDRDNGGPIPVRYGILRNQVPQWLSVPPLSPFVLQVTQAHVRHGGGGAYYVYLRRKR